MTSPRPLLILALSLLLPACGSEDARYAGDASPSPTGYPHSATPTAAPTSTPVPNGSPTPPSPDATPNEPITPTPGETTPAPCDDASGQAHTLYMSADDSNSQADPAHARQLIEEGGFVYEPLRMYEVYNFHTFDFEPAGAGHIRITPEIRRVTDPSASVDEYELIIGVTAPFVAASARRPYNLTFSVDTSGSMGGLAIENAQHALRAIAGGLRSGDVVSMVDWSTEQRVLLDSMTVRGADDSRLLKIIDDLAAGGGTDLNAGLEAAYRLANKNRSIQAMNRVVLLSDGGANVGVTSAELIAENADDEEREGIYLVGIGTASYASGYNDGLMDTVTDYGKGAYLFIDSEAEAARALGGDRLTQVMDIAARDVQLAVTLPGGFKQDRFYGEEISGDPREVEPQHLSPNDSMLYHLTLLDCLKGRDAGETTFAFTARWRDPETNAPREEEVVMTLAEMLGGNADALEKTFALTLYGAALTDVFSKESAQRRAYLEQTILLIQAINLELQDPELSEALRLLNLYKARF